VIAMTNFTMLLPDMTAEAFAAAPQRNLEALVAAGQVVAAGSHAVVTHQMAALQLLAQNGLAALQATWGAKDVQAGLKTQLDFVMGAHEKALTLTAEIAEIAQKTGRDAFEVLRRRAEATTVEAVAVRKKVA
jgi:phasin family protein